MSFLQKAQKHDRADFSLKSNVKTSFQACTRWFSIKMLPGHAANRDHNLPSTKSDYLDVFSDTRPASLVISPSILINEPANPSDN